VAADARGAGYRELALQVRAPRFPYALGEYRLSIASPRAVPLRVRDADTVRMVVRSLDFQTVADAPPPQR
jgi:hypothetical protein